MAKRSLKACLILHSRKMPAATEDIKWGDHLVFSVATKMFVLFDVDDASRAVRFKCDEEDFDRLCEREGVAPSAYVGRYGWVEFEDADEHDLNELKRFISKSHRLVVSKLSMRKQREVFGG